MKRLLISVPSGPHGFYSQNLAWWLTGVQVQSTIREFARTLADTQSDLATRMSLMETAEKFGVAWAAEQAELQWAEAEEVEDLWAPMVPDGWSVAMCPVVGSPLAANRNKQVKHFLLNKSGEKLVPTDFDAVLFIDTDNIPNRQDLHLLCEDIERDDVDIVGGVYCMDHPKGPQPIVYQIADDWSGFKFDTMTLTKERGLHKLKGGGLPTGCLMVKRRVFEKMWEQRRVWFKDRLRDASFEHFEIHDLLTRHKGNPEALVEELTDEMNERGFADWGISQTGNWHIGEDIWFCRMALDMGYDLWVDTRVHWDHVKKTSLRDVFNRQEHLGRRFFELGQEGEVRGLDYERYMRMRALNHGEPVKTVRAEDLE